MWHSARKYVNHNKRIGRPIVWPDYWNNNHNVCLIYFIRASNIAQYVGVFVKKLKTEDNHVWMWIITIFQSENHVPRLKRRQEKTTSTTKKKEKQRTPLIYWLRAIFRMKRQIMCTIIKSNNNNRSRVGPNVKKQQWKQSIFKQERDFIWNCSHETKCKVDIFLILWFYWC